MPKLLKKNQIKIFFYLFLAAVTTFSIYQKFVSRPSTIDEVIALKETYDPSLNRIQSIEDLDNEVKLWLKNDFSDTAKVVNALDDILRSRFYHGYSEYSMRGNWVAYICSKMLFWGIKHPVIPDDILKYPMAACSQQALVFQKMLDKYNVPYATVAFGINNNKYSGHYAVSAFYDGTWHFFDSNQEPQKVEGNPSIEDLIQKKQLENIYIDNVNITTAWLTDKLQNETIHTVGINTINGKKMYILQYFLGFLNAWMWLICIVLSIFFCAMWIKNKKNIVV